MLSVAGSFAPQAMITSGVKSRIHEHASLKSPVSPSKVTPIFRLENWKFLGEFAAIIVTVAARFAFQTIRAGSKKWNRARAATVIIARNKNVIQPTRVIVRERKSRPILGQAKLEGGEDGASAP